MLIKLARKISSFFLSKGIIPEESKEVYDYSFEILLSTLLNLISVFFIAVISHTIWISLCFLIGFVIVRGTAGGYHAETHLSCFLLLLGAYVGFLVLFFLLPEAISPIVSLLFILTSILLVFLLSPVEDHNKPLTTEETRKLRLKSRLTIILLSIISSLIIWFGNHKFGFALSSGTFVVAVSLIAGTIKNKRRQIKKVI